MGNEFRGQAAHSAEHFGDTRDHWWNRDFVELVVRRFALDRARDVLDVGCGVGHWSMVLEAVLPKETRFTGMDREASWVDAARARAVARGVADRFAYVTGDAQRLPFADESFDLVTCQTVLIHLPDPAAAIREMRRVLRPGGRVMVAEPNNLSESLLLDSITNRASTDEIVELVRLQLTCERGKAALGEGDNSLGDRVPGLFVAAGLTDVRVFANDKALAIFPPYTSDAQRAFIEDLRDQVARRRWNWDEPEARRLFLAGGGDASTFDAHFARALASRERIVRGIADGTYHGTVGGLFYLVTGTRSP